MFHIINLSRIQKILTKFKSAHAIIKIENPIKQRIHA